MENIMVLSNFNIRLIDFGYGVVLKSPNEYLKKYCGTPYYMPPEMIQKIFYKGIFDLFLILRKTN